MRLRDVAFCSLRRRKARAAFLVAGLLIGVGTVVALLTLSRALTVEAQNDLETYGADIIVAPRDDGFSLTYGGVPLGGVSVGARDIREAELARLATIPNHHNIAVVAPELLGAVSVGGRQSLLMGVRPADEFKLKQWWSVDGRPPRSRNEVVAGANVAAALRLHPGSRVRIAGRTLLVSGVLRATGSQDDDLIISDLTTAQGVLGRPGRVTMVEVAALCSNCPVGDIAAQIGAVLPGTRVTPLQQTVKNRMAAISQFRTFSWIVAAVIVVIEALVVFVTMMGSVHARTREIGILRALGFRRGHVTGLILIEAVTASLLAGVLGFLAGMGLSYAVLPLLSSGVAAVSWTPLIAAAAVGLAVAVGALASLYPALRASRLDPTVALRAL